LVQNEKDSLTVLVFYMYHRYFWCNK